MLPDAMTRVRSSALRSLACALVALWLAPAVAHGETFKCIDATGKASYQSAPCKTAAEETLKVQAPVPISSPASAAPAATLTRSTRDRVPTEADFRGPRETWERLTQAVLRGDKEAAMRELTPAAQERLATVFDTIGSKTTPLTADELGSIRSVMLAGDGLATIKLNRKKADGTYAHDVMLIRNADGKWRIDNM